MNFLDTYDITASGGATPPSREQPSLNEEVSQVIGQFGRFWGGFRKQSQTVFESARKDLGDVVTQAQKELNKLTSATEVPAQPSGPSSDADANLSASTSTLREASDTTAQTNTQTLFSRLQSSLPPNVVSTVRDHLPESLKQASENVDLAQLRTNLLSEFQRVQGVTRTQAEEYVRKSEALLREAVKEAGEVMREAVKVIPPESDGEDIAPKGFVWDGTDMWMFPTDTAESSGSGKQRESNETPWAVTTRAEALIRRLKTDPEIVQHDPEADVGVKDQYTRWLSSEVEPKEGGISGDEWRAKISAILEEPVNGPALRTLHGSLVPFEMEENVFWSRFFFRDYQIRREEEKRKALLQGLEITFFQVLYLFTKDDKVSTAESEDDFSWEDEDEDPNPNTTNKASVVETSAQPDVLGVPLKFRNSPRVSSEDSFDVVSGNVSVAGDDKLQDKKLNNSEDGDSDWE